MNIGRFSVKNPVFLNILMVTVLILGGLSLSRMPREQFAEVPFYWVSILVPYPGVAAEDVEKLITIPVENEMQGLDNLDKIQSVTSEGVSSVRVEFDSGISQDEFDKLFQDVRARFSKVSLPEGTLESTVDDFSSNDFLPVVELVLSISNEEADESGSSYAALIEEAERLQEQILRISDVSSADFIGARDREIFIEVNPGSLESYGLSVNEMVQAIQGRNSNVPGGTLSNGRRQMLVRTIGELGSVEEFKDVIIRQTADGNGFLRMGDVAEVKDGYDPRGVRSRFNGRTAVTIRVAKVPRGNSIAIVEELRELSVKWEESLPPGISLDIQNDSTIQIRDSIDILVNNALFGLILLVVLLFAFVGLRNALMTALGIPVTFALTFLILDLSGETFNSNTLFALVLVLGLIVDHAIVIIENSFRLEQLGLERRQAAIDGTNQVVLPVFAATATTVAAFIPLMLLPGTIGRFLRIIPLTVSIALIVSTLEAVIFLPSHYADWPERKRKKNREEGFYFHKVQNGFSEILGRIYKKKKLSVIIIFVFSIASFSLVPFLNQDLFSAEDFTLFYIDVDLPPGSSLESTEDLIEEYEERLIPLVGNGEIAGINSFIGFRGESAGNTVQGNLGQIVVDLTEKSEGRDRSIIQIMAELKSLTSDIPGAEQIIFRRATNGPPTSSPVSYRLFGDSYKDLTRVSSVIREELGSYPELYNIRDNYESGTPELRVVVDGDAAARNGMSAVYIGQFIRASLDGVRASSFFQNNKDVEIFIGFSAAGELKAEELSQLKILSPSGSQVPLSSLTRLEQGNALASIRRLDGKREITITADAYDNSGLRDINGEIKALYEQQFERRYPDMRLSVGGEFSDLDDLLIQIARIFLLGIFLIYLILGAQFNSYSQPFLILLTVPFAFVGVVIYLFISGTPFSTTVLYSAVALAGIAVNDSIVLISFVNELRDEGMAVAQAVLEAARTRLRPILLTSLTTIAGLLPTALGLGGESVVWGPMASTIIFGLIFSTITALILIPAFYGILYDKGAEGE
ncbi:MULTISPECIES: efflux RND transporter permease subunit [unclassified Oceanispirochaeta]|uniref:efflux RND transporter permease subunit n=1 Tax=unclassified Oceanispirochaeta TaxID=2635722 RepID=UPI000E093319|nr:efflux RND transporter permease subunit [Oceanispirochaeta sp. M1]MBF9017027.1 efflux RND transporter permease subunit [Oceanispirochaeta sp. M2]NPD73476.1 efflux RND transporter permease subunit [Oceanispirochaeta sp. M1]RDG30768.1 AcrB/AcrD/AcrF family protein [Oceanispirochaeta sp. M1]